MRKSIITVAVAGIFAFPALALANPINPSFETGDLTGWNGAPASKVSVVNSFTASTNSGDSSGSVDVNTFRTWNPYEGDYFAVTRADDPATLSQTFHITGGQTLSFAYGFFARDTGGYYNDEGGYTIGLSGSSGVYTKLIDVDTVGDYNSMEDWVVVNYIVPETGDYTLTFLSTNVGNAPRQNEYNSAFFIDAIKVSQVSEPATLALMSLGTLALFGFVARRRGEGYGDGSIAA